MTQEDKDLLFKYLCMALPYGVKVQVYYEDIAGSGYFDDTVWSIDNDEPFHANDRWIENIKPYLRSMSSMTEEEYRVWHYLYLPIPHENEATETKRRIDWLLKNHFDFMGLIPKNLAIEVTKENNPYEK